MRVLWLSVLISVVAVPAFAQQDAPRAYDMIRSSDSYRKAVMEIYQSYESALSTHCPKIEMNMNTSEAKVLSAFTTDANGNIVNGSWQETTDGVACGEKRLYNALVVMKDGRSQVLALFPGHSHASSKLQRDAVPYAAAGASVGEGCTADIVDTALPNGEPADEHTAWAEKWTVRSCGKSSVVTMHFVPNATGTTINVKPAETVALP